MSFDATETAAAFPGGTRFKEASLSPLLSSYTTIAAQCFRFLLLACFPDCTSLLDFCPSTSLTVSCIMFLLSSSWLFYLHVLIYCRCFLNKCTKSYEAWTPIQLCLYPRLMTTSLH
ncbi:hypothetical protein DFH11DRAFT_1596287, partial [Phellopilus nigrolimitatus]